MAIYLGSSEKLKIMIDNISYNLIIAPSHHIFNGIKLLTYDNLILKDSNGVYLTAKEDENYD